MEHLGEHGVHDGICVTVLLEAKTTELDKGRGYAWCKVERSLENMVKEALARNCAQLHF